MKTVWALYANDLMAVAPLGLFVTKEVAMASVRKSVPAATFVDLDGEKMTACRLGERLPGVDNTFAHLIEEVVYDVPVAIEAVDSRKASIASEAMSDNEGADDEVEWEREMERRVTEHDAYLMEHSDELPW